MTLETLERKKIGEYLKNERKKKGIKSSLLVEEGLSQSTISNIERGIISVDIGRIKRLCEKLGIDIDQIVQDLQEIDRDQENVQELLQGIESLLAHNLNTEKCLKMLDEIQNKFSMNTPYIFYLRGKCHIRNKQWDKAKLALRQSVELCKTNQDNLKSAALYELSRVFYYTKEFEQALDFVDQGLNQFNDKGERKYIKYYFCIIKVFILEDLKKFGEALNTLSNMWEYIEQIDDMKLVVNMYVKRASLLIQLDMFTEAVYFILEGIEKARRNELLDRSCELWVALADSYLLMKKLTKAKTAIEIALEMTTQSSEITTAYAYLTFGKILKAEDKIEQAMEQFNLANKLARSTKIIRYIIDSHILLGDCFMNDKKIKKALREYKNAENVVIKTKNTDKELDVAWRICKCLEEQFEGKEEIDEELKSSLHKQYKSVLQLVSKEEG